MKAKPAPPAITMEGLLGKSHIYVQRAFRAKTAGDLDEYQLWLSLAVELLGKASLADIHPSLVVDPQHSKSLFAASGINISSDSKTITASTLFERLSHLSKYFDKGVKEFCDAISLRPRFESHGAANRLRFGWETRWTIRRIMARVTMASDTSGRCS